MKYRKIQTLSLLIVFSFGLSVTMAPQHVKSQDIQTNFQAWFFTQAGSRITEAYALYLKQALAPLGIDVKVVAKPFGQFVGDLQHYTTGHPFDLAQIRFANGGPIPAFMWAYHSTDTSFGQSFYQLNDPDWQAWQEVDTGVKTADVDALLEAIEFEVDIAKRQALVDQFAELYMTKLLYDFPMVSGIFRTAMWKGYGGPNNELWDVDEGTTTSRALGAIWTSNPSVRQGSGSNTTTLRLSQVNPSKKTFDPGQSFDTATSAISGPMSTVPILFDKGFAPHPGLAVQWYVQDWFGDSDDNVSTPDDWSRQGHHTFVFRDNAVWPATTDYQGNPVPARTMDANDMLLQLEAQQLTQIIVNGQEAFIPMLKANVTTTVFTNDTLDVYIKAGRTAPDDMFKYGSYNAPLPYHLLGGDLHLTDENGTYVGTMQELDALGKNPQDSDEWSHWASESGHSLIGPYEIQDYVDSEYRSYNARSDWYYPNEWDTVKEYAAHTTEYDALAMRLNATNPPDLSYFAPHLYTERQDAYYWSYASDETNMVKPTNQGITTVFHVIIEDTNARLLAYEAGTIDVFGSSSLGAQKVEDHENNPDMVVQTQTPDRGPELLVFNLLHPHLKKLEVRLAIAHALDKTKLIKIHDGFAQRVDSPVWKFQGSWYKPFPLDYNYTEARDLMRSNGYFAAETNAPISTVPQPPVSTAISSVTTQISTVLTDVSTAVTDVTNAVTNVSKVTEGLGSSALIFFAAFGVGMLSIIRRKFKN
jgi:ABC-type transport system substrate-binding protein